VRQFPSGTLVVLKLWTFLFSSKQTCSKHAKAISYSLQKKNSNDVLHSPIKDHLALALRGFVVKSQIRNLTFGPSFDHNSRILSLNE
jgi:hypothetical protein